jgi:hypothetical protein
VHHSQVEIRPSPLAPCRKATPSAMTQPGGIEPPQRSTISSIGSRRCSMAMALGRDADVVARSADAAKVAR